MARRIHASTAFSQRRKRFGRSLSPLWLILLLAVLPLSNARAYDVPLRSEVYTFLDRMDMRGLFAERLSGVRPYTREDVARLLIELRGHEKELTRVEQGELEEYCFRFSDEMDRLSPGSGETGFRPEWNRISRSEYFRSLHLFSNNRDIMEIERDDWRFFANGMAGYEADRIPDPEWTAAGLQTIVNYGLEGGLRYRHLEIYGSGTDATISSKDAIYDTLRFPYRNFNTTQTSFDFYRTISSFSYQDAHFLVQFGKGENAWGYGESGSLVLSGKTLSYTYLRLRGRFGPIEMTMLQGKLTQQPPVYTSIDSLQGGAVRRNYADKWMAAHRYEFTLHRSFRIGFFEQVIYGERGPDPDYFHPLSFIRGIEHFGRDRDNVLIGFDGHFYPVAGMALFGQFLIDDMQFSKIFSNDSRADRNAQLVSLKLSDPLILRNTLVYAEYARVRPFVYSHKFEINIDQHWGVNLGYPIPPNSDQLTLGLRLFPHKRLTLEAEWQQWRHGANPSETVNVGGDVLRSIRDHAKASVRLLEGDREMVRTAKLSIRYEPVYDLILEGSLAHQGYSFHPISGTSRERSFQLYTLALIWHPLS